ncbi:RecA-like DNA recombinase [Gordonia phage Pupper]|uniref:RecA-like DNA recombinase n=1 Tax=Gordonia phage Pupper TaxID=2571249 RepID=A0A4Y6EIT1_9CAUD|nr:UvsX-like recombinase [Gordonia phage Pupper]QDF18640.1 RecA-like DNA recombinase [Gordonia phage Pupper]QDF18872.1 RecA-like DNA recombinase [Gordonia phage SCentae]
MNRELDKVMDKINERYGANSVMMASDVPVRPAIPSGSLALDFAIGIGGLPPDRVIEVAGGEGSGKTTLGLLSMAQFLDAQPKREALIIDTEHKLTMTWVEKLIGVERMKRVRLVWPNHMEQATQIFTEFVSTGQVCFVLFDSIGGAPTAAAMSKDAEVGEVGGNARAVTRFARLAATYSQKFNCLTFAVNQIREDMEGYRRHITPGGKAWGHACILRIKLKKSTKEKAEAVIDGEKMPVGFLVQAQVIKNQLAAPGRTASWWFYNIETEENAFGVDTLEELVRIGIAVGVVERKGAFYNHPRLPGGKVQGRGGLVTAVRNDPAVRDDIVADITAAITRDRSLSKVAPIDPEFDEAAQ